MADALVTARRKLDEEADKQIEIIFRVMALALGEDGWSLKRLEKVADQIHDFIDELGKLDKSVVQICDEEVGIKLIPEGVEKHWDELTYLNGNKWDKFLEDHKNMPTKMLRAYAIRASQKMMQWIRPQFYGAVLVAMHRLYGYGNERASRLYMHMYEIEMAADSDAKKLDEELIKKKRIRMVRPKGKRFYFEAVK